MIQPQRNNNSNFLPYFFQINTVQAILNMIISCAKLRLHENSAMMSCLQCEAYFKFSLLSLAAEMCPRRKLLSLRHRLRQWTLFLEIFSDRYTVHVFKKHAFTLVQINRVGRLFEKWYGIWFTESANLDTKKHCHETTRIPCEKYDALIF